MTISLPKRKIDKIKDTSQKLLWSALPTIREVASLVGQYVATAEAVPYATLHLREIEKEKNRALQRSKGNFGAFLVKILQI